MTALNILIEVFTENVWPLCFLLVALIILKRAREDVRPIFIKMRDSLTAQAGKYAMLWAFALLTATLASLQALQEVAQQMQWVYVAAAAKIMQPGLAVLVAYGRQNSTTEKPTNTNQ